MNRKQLRIQIGNKIRAIRFKHLNSNDKPMRQAEFTKLLNETAPKDIRIETAALGQYERGDVAIPGDKLEKIYSLSKEES